MEIKLSRKEICFIDGDARNISIKCTTGSLWITQPNDPYDHILHIGDIHNVSQKGKVVMFAVADSAIKFSNSALYSNKKMCLFWSSPLARACGSN
ncbi:DUF2917 domain-containing protein [Desulfospira joergensenii]|uniref:DUF2917 domain-containing protein n=1 Tax=Desulfospira joergensenii TaxID=53329 RepID=UPI0003B4DB75|nr:DUF2917 domain-containing protein [Desulfospira joergensenii]